MSLFPLVLLRLSILSLRQVVIDVSKFIFVKKVRVNIKNNTIQTFKIGGVLVEIQVNFFDEF